MLISTDPSIVRKFVIATYVNHKITCTKRGIFAMFSVEPKLGHHHYVLLIVHIMRVRSQVLFYTVSLSVLCSNLQTLLFSSQFITDKFLYDQSVAMESLLDCGLKEQLFELAKVGTC